MIVGRAGFYILREYPNSIHVFIHAPIEFRVKRLMEVQKIADIKEARSKIDKSDFSREKFIRTMTGINWTDARNYHICLDTFMVGFSVAEEIIVKQVV